MARKDDWLGDDRLDEHDIEEFKRANRLLQLSLDDAKMRAYDRIDSGHWAIAHSGYYRSLHSETRNQLLLQIVDAIKEQTDAIQNLNQIISKSVFTINDK